MKIMNEYTYLNLKKNKRHTISILTSIIIASSLLCSLCIFLYSIWSSKVESAVKEKGYWQSEISESISGSKLSQITENKNVQSTMIKGTWVTAQLKDTKRPYFLMRDANKDFWKNMNFKNGVIEGRLPENTGEIVVSKLFFADNPEYKIGDELTLPVGRRVLNNEVLDTQSYKREGEGFAAEDTKTYTIVGNLDISGISAFPGYIAMGYLDNNNIKDNDELTVYMNFKNPRRIYTEMPEIAESLGLDKDEYGEYAVDYNTKLLSLYGISNKSSSNTQFILIAAVAVMMVMLVMGAFILIIYNAFALSANSRIKELSILKSLGASPKQIKYSVLYEGFLLWIVQLPISILIGYLFSFAVLSKVNEILSLTENYQSINVCFSWIIIIFSTITSLITVLVSAYIPARKTAKISAIAGILIHDGSMKVKKHKSGLIGKKIFGIEGELAASEFAANKKSMRTAVLSLAMCFILIAGYISIISIYNLADSKNAKTYSHDVSIDLDIIDKPDEKMINEIVDMPEVKDSVIRRQVCTSLLVTEDEASDDLLADGGLQKVSEDKSYVVKEDDKFRIIVNLTGLSDESFKKYCKDIGVDYNKYYKQDADYGILINDTFHTPEDSRIAEEIPFLKTKAGNNMCLNEKIEDDSNVDNKFNVEIGDVTDKYPTTQIQGDRYRLNLIIPMEKYIKIVKSFSPARSLECSKISIDLLAAKEEEGLDIKEKLTKICDSYLGYEDYSIWTLKEEINHQELVQKASKTAVSAVALMIGAIGIFNAFSIITNNMRLRKREFSMLRSIGLTPAGLNKMLVLEGLFFALRPILISILPVSIICAYMLKLTSITWSEFTSVFQGLTISIYALCIFAAILIAYYFSAKSIKRSNIMEGIKDEIV